MYSLSVQQQVSKKRHEVTDRRQNGIKQSGRHLKIGGGAKLSLVCSPGGAGVQVAGREAGLTTGGDTQLDTPDSGEAE